MQRLFLICILSIISFGINAGNINPGMIVVPYLESMSDKVSMDDEQQCDDEAWYGATMLNDTRDDIPLNEQLAIWDLTDELWEEGDPDFDKMYDLVNLTWVMSHTYPDLSPEEYAESIYFICISTKPLISDKVQF